MVSTKAKFIAAFIVLYLICAYTGMAALSPGDGILLKRSPEETCHVCHKTYKNAPADANSIKTHSSALLGSSKWGGKWGTNEADSKYGEIICTTCHTAHDTKNIYLIKETVVSSANGAFPGSTVDFRAKSGTAGTTVGTLGDDTGGHGTSTKICEVCHSQNKFHNYNTAANTGGTDHYNANDCTQCHPHKRGFKASCDICHGNPPTGNTLGGPNGLANNPAPTGSATAGAHAKHVTTLGHPCSYCHYNSPGTGNSHMNTKVTVGFVNRSTGGSYDGQTTANYDSSHASTTVSNTGTRKCSNTYCHSSGTGGTANSNPTPGAIPPVYDVRPVASNTSPAWDGTFPMACSNWTGQSCLTSGCHAPSGPGSSYYRCSLCHTTRLSTPASYSSANYYAVPDQITNTYSTDSHKCYGCHGYPPIYQRDYPKANSHNTEEAHRIKCNFCHYATTTDGETITNPAKHNDGIYDLQADPVNAPNVWSLSPGQLASFTYVYDAGGGQCSNNACHGSGTWTWGRTLPYVYALGYSHGPECYQVNFDYLDIQSGTPPYISYNWDFGDGTTGTGFPVSHNYTSKGPYTVTLSGRDSKGYSFSRTLSNYVSPQQSNTAPVAAGSFSVSGYTATLTDLSYDPDYNQCDHTGSGTIYIDWGDYTNETFTINLTNAPSNRTFSHTYSTANAGTHRVSQQIKDNAGAAASVTTNVTVPSTTTVSGRVTKNGAGVSGVYINFYNQGTTTPLIKRVLTDANGYWPATTINEGQCYTLKPYKYGITFTPASQDVCGFNDQVNFIAN